MCVYVCDKDGGPQNARCRRWLAGVGQPHECTWIAKYECGVSRGADETGRSPRLPRDDKELGLKIFAALQESAPDDPGISEWIR